MKVTVYVMRSEKRTEARWTFAPEVDYAYWLDAGWRGEAELVAGEVAGTEGGRRIVKDFGKAGWQEFSPDSREMIAWSEALPLGHAVQVAERWPGGVMTAERAGQTLSRIVDDVWAGDARMGLPVSRQPGGARALAGAGGARPGPAGALAARACRAAALLQGRALLSSEALALLEAAGAAGPAGAAATAWSAWAPALQLAALLGRLRLGGAVATQPQPRPLRWRQALGARPRPRFRCQRCGSGAARMRRTPCAACGRACAYCEACLTMGRSRECGLLLFGAPPALVGEPEQWAPPSAIAGDQPASQSSSSAFAGVRPTAPQSSSSAFAGKQPAPQSSSSALAGTQPAPQSSSSALAGDQPTPKSPTASMPQACPAAPALSAWNLSPAQTAAATAALNYIEKPSARDVSRRRFLIWAVTGAGKTEMIFPLVAACLARGGRALIATPRRDVVLELNPRIRRAFPDASVVTLYGGSEQRWEQGQITIATTHQLFRFGAGFELVIVDEIDAFPYHGDPMLHYATEKAKAPGGVHILLSATPPAGLRLEARLGRLAHVRVPVRFHRHPLPVPRQLRIPPVRKMLAKRSLPRILVTALHRSIGRGAQLFVFVQLIRDVEPLVALLRQAFPSLAIEGTSSQDPARADKVMRFRERGIRLLVTTTILERGVTVPRSDVFILDADGRLFDDASLIQMAGRAGRSKDDPNGLVYLCGAFRTRAQRSAIAQIRGMNRIARRQGYLLANERK